jgi:hypothetical protein
MPPPIRLKIAIAEVILEFALITGTNKNTPYPPSFSKMAASTIEPATGASTWALGSHKWTPYMGYFTKNPAINNSIIREGVTSIALAETLEVSILKK